MRGLLAKCEQEGCTRGCRQHHPHTSSRLRYTSTYLRACADARMWQLSGNEHPATRSKFFTGPMLVRRRRAKIAAASPCSSAPLPRAHRRIRRRIDCSGVDDVLDGRECIGVLIAGERRRNDRFRATPRWCGAACRLVGERFRWRHPLFRARRNLASKRGLAQSRLGVSHRGCVGWRSGQQRSGHGVRSDPTHARRHALHRHALRARDCARSRAWNATLDVRCPHRPCIPRAQ